MHPLYEGVAVAVPTLLSNKSAIVKEDLSLIAQVLPRLRIGGKLSYLAGRLLRESEGKGRGIAEADDALSSFRTMVLTVLDSASPILREKADFRQSMSMYGSQHSGAMAGSSEALEVSAVLERYSDRLVDLVSEKMVSKRKSLSKEYST